MLQCSKGKTIMTTRTATHWTAAGTEPGWMSNLLTGLAMGWRAYRSYGALSAKSDGELQALGLTRADLPRAAVFGIKSI